MEIIEGKMGFLKKNRVPGELPDLILNSSLNSSNQSTPRESSPNNFLSGQRGEPKPIIERKILTEPKIENKAEIQRKDYQETQRTLGNDFPPGEIKKEIGGAVSSDISGSSFFDKMLNDINGEIQDLGKLEDWYKTKFFPQDVVSNMRNYWEDNKAEMIIKSFGSEYKERINQKVKTLQELEADWREIYFKLMKKEEEMKKEERILKETLSEFVELCKRRSGNDEKGN